MKNGQIIFKIMTGIGYAFILFQLILSLVKKQPITEILPNYNWWVLFVLIQIWFFLNFERVKIQFDEDENEQEN